MQIDLARGACPMRRPLATICPSVSLLCYRIAVRPLAAGVASAISAIIFLTMASPNELKSLASMTKLPGPPVTLSR
jgi:hypothetical protein